MKVKDVLNLVEILLQKESSQNTPDRTKLLQLLQLALGSLNDQFNTFIRKLDPIVLTQDEVREYSLPEDFGENFVRRGNRYLCKCKDTYSEWDLKFEPVEDFYDRDFVSETSSRPHSYTILTGFDGRRKLVISPKPDGEYTVYGLYRPRWTEVTEESEIPLAQPGFLVFYLASLIDQGNPRWLLEAQGEKRWLYVNAAREKDLHAAPDYDRYLNGERLR